MPDTLSQGGDREPSPWPRRLALAAVLVLAAALIVTHLPRAPRSAARPQPTRTAAATTPAASSAAQPAVAVAAVPDGIIGPVLPWPGGLRLPAAGQRPAWLLPGTGQLVPIEVSTAGAPLGPQLRLPAGYQIQEGTDRGLLLTPVAPQPESMHWRLWDPASPRAGRTFAAVIAASTTQIAWTPACAARCGVRVLNLATGRQVTAELPAGRSPVNAAFSPDGRFLAVEESFSNEGDDGGQAVQLAVVSVASGRLMTVPGTWLSSDALISFGWPASSDTLVAQLSFTTKEQLMSWRPGAARLAVAALTPRQNPASLVVGQY